MKRWTGLGQTEGCGRALWERIDNGYGTTMALMLLPFWTDGCIGSSEGLFFEASGTTPYLFITADAMSRERRTPRCARSARRQRRQRRACPYLQSARRSGT